MASESGGPLLTFIRRLAAAHDPGDQADGELLRRFALRREEAAFTTLMHRHGPMVLGVCQSILRDAQDAEDAFQATFLVLARKAGAISKPGSVASWLHGVACRLAARVRAEAARRRAHERQVVPMPTREPQEEVVWRDLRPLLHEEVARLPERYRLPFVLCYLEGKTNEEAADLLGLPKGTVLSRLSRGRERLRRRLTRRGLTLTGGLLAALLAHNSARAAVPAALAEGTLRAAVAFATGPGAAGRVAAPVLAYAQGMLRAASIARLKLATAVLLGFALAGAGAATLVRQVQRAAGEGGASAERPLSPNVPPEEARSKAQAPGWRDDDGDRMQGTWSVAAAEQSGRSIDTLKNRRFIFTGARFTLSAGRGEVRGVIPSGGMEGSLTLEPGNPGRVDLSAQRWRLRGIYAWHGESLKVCLSETNAAERPAEFTTKPGSSDVLLTLKRE
jgi:RNA polymerase sigma factor (sigma-70 family)